eukprot:TRINITY_DN60976_c0_g1_i1.p1 TRINITY_DN60976_c0_g1~~TRINITY_DN60976_c0_g1_i1.p1  ORF type:complete len:548 (-),score=90.39 TRINITY_DN60976_c0_g1_i1:34-1677(-)
MDMEKTLQNLSNESDAQRARELVSSLERNLNAQEQSPSHAALLHFCICIILDVESQDAAHLIKQEFAVLAVEAFCEQNRSDHEKIDHTFAERLNTICAAETLTPVAHEAARSIYRRLHRKWNSTPCPPGEYEVEAEDMCISPANSPPPMHEPTSNTETLPTDTVQTLFAGGPSPSTHEDACAQDTSTPVNRAPPSPRKEIPPRDNAPPIPEEKQRVVLSPTSAVDPGCPLKDEHQTKMPNLPTNNSTDEQPNQQRSTTPPPADFVAADQAAGGSIGPNGRESEDLMQMDMSPPPAPVPDEISQSHAQAAEENQQLLFTKRPAPEEKETPNLNFCLSNHKPDQTVTPHRTPEAKGVASPPARPFITPMRGSRTPHAARSSSVLTMPDNGLNMTICEEGDAYAWEADPNRELEFVGQEVLTWQKRHAKLEEEIAECKRKDEQRKANESLMLDRLQEVNKELQDSKRQVAQLTITNQQALTEVTRMLKHYKEQYARQENKPTPPFVPPTTAYGGLQALGQLATQLLADRAELLGFCGQLLSAEPPATTTA